MEAVEKILGFLHKNGAANELTICNALSISHSVFYYAIKVLLSDGRVSSYVLNRQKFFSANSGGGVSVAAVDGGADEPAMSDLCRVGSEFVSREKKPPSLSSIDSVRISRDYDDKTCEGFFPNIMDFAEVVESVLAGASVLEVQLPNRRVIVERDGDLIRYDWRPIKGGVEVRQFDLGGIRWALAAG